MMSGGWIACMQQTNDSTAQAYWDWLLVCCLRAVCACGAARGARTADQLGGGFL
jgi:hypothetical protein